MREDDDIAKIINNTEIGSFDIKQEWLDDMRSQLDAYNRSKKKLFIYRWLTLFVIPAIVLPLILLYNSKGEDVIAHQTKQIELQENARIQPIDNKTAVTSIINSNTTANQSSVDSIASINVKESKTSKSDYKKDTLSKLTNSQATRSKSKTTLVNITAPITAQSSNTHVQMKKTDEIVSGQEKGNNPDSNSKAELILQLELDETEKNNDYQIFNSSEIETTSQSESNLAVEQQSNNQNTSIKDGESESNRETDLEIDLEQKQIENSLINTSNLLFKTDSSVSLEETVVNSTTVDTAEVGEIDSEDEISNLDEAEDLKIKNADKPKLWSIGFMLGPDFLAREFTTTAELLNFEQKKKEEIFDNTWGFDFEVNRYLTPWLAVGSGIGFKKYQEINSYIPTVSTTFDTSITFKFETNIVFTDSMDSVIQNGNGGLDTVWTYTDSIEVTENISDTSITTNSITDSSKTIANGTVTSSYFQIPINAQFIFVNSDRLLGYATLGLTIGLLTKNTGRVIDYSTNEIVNYTSRKTIYSSSIGLGFNYNIIGPLDFKLYGAYQFHLSNLSLTSDINKRYNGFNLRTGLVFHF